MPVLAVPPEDQAPMKTIDEKELKAAIDRGDKIMLVMFMDRASFDRMHIPGSIHCADARAAIRRFAKDDPIVGYCSTDACVYSKKMCTQLVEAGYTDVTHFFGGLWAWQQAGYPLEGTDVNS
jgi:rhodanese-related sulfurtransferase